VANGGFSRYTCACVAPFTVRLTRASCERPPTAGPTTASPVAADASGGGESGSSSQDLVIVIVIVVIAVIVVGGIVAYGRRGSTGESTSKAPGVGFNNPLYDSEGQNDNAVDYELPVDTSGGYMDINAADTGSQDDV